MLIGKFVVIISFKFLFLLIAEKSPAEKRGRVKSVPPSAVPVPSTALVPVARTTIPPASSSSSAPEHMKHMCLHHLTKVLFRLILLPKGKGVTILVDKILSIGRASEVRGFG